MSIQINKLKCVSCGKCISACPGNLLKEDTDHKTIIRCSEDCWGCTSCIKECKTEAISYFLGADVGGLGSVMYTREEKELLHWMIKDQAGNEQTITINKKQANAY